MKNKYHVSMEDKLLKVSKYVLVAGIIGALYVLITSMLHTTFGSKIVNPPPASQFMGPNAKN